MKQLSYVVLFSILAFSCGRFGNTEEAREHSERIVCISKQYNEIIFALGAEKDIVAVDLSSTYPPEIKDLPTVGYHRALSAEGILSMKPTLIIHDNNIGPQHVVDQVTALEIPMKVFNTHASDIDSTKMLIREMGEYFEKPERAEELCHQLDTEMQRALEAGQSMADTPSVLVIHFGRASNIYLVMTNKSSAARMIEWAGGRMAINEEKGMRHLSAEVVAESDPDIIIVTDFGYDRLGSVEKVKELPGVSGTRAARNNRIYRFEEHDLVYFGPRTGSNVLKLQEMLHDTAEVKTEKS